MGANNLVQRTYLMVEQGDGFLQVVNSSAAFLESMLQFMLMCLFQTLDAPRQLICGFQQLAEMIDPLTQS